MNVINNMMNDLPTVISAVIILVVAVIVAAIIRAIVKKIVGKFLEKKLASVDEEVVNHTKGTVNIIGNIVFAIVFILFLPGALEKLGLTSVSGPISQMASKFINFLPNLIAACIVIFFGIFLARLVCQIVTRILKNTKFDSLLQKAGGTSSISLSVIVGKIVYALIAIIFVVAGIQILNIPAISEPSTQMISKIFNFVPLLFAAGVLVAFGIFLGKIVGNILASVLATTKLDEFSRSNYQKGSEDAIPASKVIGTIASVVIYIIFIVSAINILNITVLTEVGMAVIRYLPSVIVACLIVLIAWAASNALMKFIVRTYPNAASLAKLIRVIIMVLAGFMALSQLGISQNIIDTLFMWICIGGAAAFAISFGIGGKDAAKSIIENVRTNTAESLKHKVVDEDIAAEVAAEKKAEDDEEKEIEKEMLGTNPED